MEWPGCRPDRRDRGDGKVLLRRESSAWYFAGSNPGERPWLREEPPPDRPDSGPRTPWARASVSERIRPGHPNPGKDYRGAGVRGNRGERGRTPGSMATWGVQRNGYRSVATGRGGAEAPIAAKGLPSCARAGRMPVRVGVVHHVGGDLHFEPGPAGAVALQFHRFLDHPEAVAAHPVEESALPVGRLVDAGVEEGPQQFPVSSHHRARRRL